EHDQQESHPELRDRVSDHAKETHDVVDPAAAIERRNDTEGHTDPDLQDQREDSELEGRWKSFQEESERRLVVLKGLPKIAPEHVHQPVHVLHRQGLVEPVEVPERGDVRLGDVGRAERVETHWVTWRKPRDREDDDGDPEQRGNRVQDAPDDVFAHRFSVTSGPAMTGGAPRSGAPPCAWNQIEVIA